MHFNEVQLGMLIGGSSSGDVYRGTWQSRPVAVKVCVCVCAYQRRNGCPISHGCKQQCAMCVPDVGNQSKLCWPLACHLSHHTSQVNVWILKVELSQCCALMCVLTMDHDRDYQNRHLSVDAVLWPYNCCCSCWSCVTFLCAINLSAMPMQLLSSASGTHLNSNNSTVISNVNRNISNQLVMSCICLVCNLAGSFCMPS